MRPVADSDVTPPLPPSSPEPSGDPSGEAPGGAPPTRSVGGATFQKPKSKPMRPIGPAALKALREAIRSGRYPNDAAVREGLERMMRRPPEPRS